MHRRVIFLLLFLALAAVYGQILGHDFIVMDDQAVLQQNPRIAGGVSWEGAAWFFTHFYDGNWIPLNWISHMLAAQVFGMKAAGGHLLINLLLHAANTFLLFLILEKTTGKFGRSLFAAALFALHPLHVESVAWVSERKDVLSGFFWMLSLWVYVNRHSAVSPSPHPSPRRGEGRVRGMLRHTVCAMPALLFFALALMSKPMALTLPLILWLLDYWRLGDSHFFKRHFDERSDVISSEARNLGISPPLGRRNDPRLRLEMTKASLFPFFILSAASACLTYLAHRSLGWVHSFETLPFDIRLANAALSVGKYLRKTIWPVDLAAFYPYEPAQAILMKGAVWAAVLGLFTLWVVRKKSERPYLFVGWFWFLIGLAPALGIVSFAGFSMADRFTYLPLTGIFIILAWGVPEILEKMKNRFAPLTFILSPSGRGEGEGGTRSFVILGIGSLFVVLTFALFTWRQAGFWKNTETLFSRALAVTQNNFIADAAVAGVYARAGGLDRAVLHFERSIAVYPAPSTLINLGLVYNQKGLYQKGGGYLAQGLQKDPEILEGYPGLADSLIHQGRRDEARFLLKGALQKWPQEKTLKDRLALLQEGEGVPAEVFGKPGAQAEP